MSLEPRLQNDGYHLVFDHLFLYCILTGTMNKSQSFMTLAFVSSKRTFIDFSFSGKNFISFFLSYPTRLVQSFWLLHFPSAFNFSQIENVITMSFMASTSFIRCRPLASPHFLSKSSLLSFSNISIIKF